MNITDMNGNALRHNQTNLEQDVDNPCVSWG